MKVDTTTDIPTDQRNGQKKDRKSREQYGIRIVCVYRYLYSYIDDGHHLRPSTTGSRKPQRPQRQQRKLPNTFKSSKIYVCTRWPRRVRDIMLLQYTTGTSAEEA